MNKVNYTFAYYSLTETNKKIIKYLKKSLPEWWIINEESPEYVFVLGGDGTFLHIVNKYVNKNVKLIGINSGTLGFYTIGNWNILKKQIDLDAFLRRRKYYFNPLVIESDIYSGDVLQKKDYALNDLVIQSPYTIKSQFLLNNQEFMDSASTGLIFCTPTGSTGSNKSNHGPIFFSSLNAYCLSMIMPINNKKYFSITNPLLFSKEERLTWILKNENLNFQIINDGILINVKQINRIEIKLITANCQIFMPEGTLLALKHHKNFF